MRTEDIDLQYGCQSCHPSLKSFPSEDDDDRVNRKGIDLFTEFIDKLLANGITLFVVHPDL